MMGVPFGAVQLGGKADNGEPMLHLVTEQPERVAGFEREVSKQILERLHLEKFRFDYLLRRGAIPFDDVRSGDDPPDFILITRGAEARLDCAALTIQHRRRAYDRFRRLTERLAAGAGRRDFSGLKGTAVAVWFGERMEQEPPGRSDDALVDPLLDMLADATVDRDAHRRLMEEVDKAHGLPQQLPQGFLTEGSTPDRGVGFFANVVCEPEQAEDILGPAGFSIALHMPQPLTLDDVRAELERLTLKHDKPEIESLLVTAGGPDRNGIRYPAEELVAAQLAEGGDLALEAQHIQEVFLHLWGSCDVSDVDVLRSSLNV
jgi:hypothetical protein